IRDFHVTGVQTCALPIYKVFERAGTDLHAKMSLPMTAAALGCELKLETFDGEQRINVEPGAQDGDTVTLSELGVPRLRGGKRGEIGRASCRGDSVDVEGR